MADEAKLRQQQDRGRKAREVLENELVQEALQTMRSETAEAWRHSKIDETDLREDCWRMERLLDRFEAVFRQIVTTGEHARKDLLRVEEDNRLKKAFRHGRR